MLILDKTFYEEKILWLISDVNKFKELNKDTALIKEGNLQHFVRKIIDKSLFNDNSYNKIYTGGSRPASIYGLPKTHKLLSNDFQDLLFCPIVSSVATCNYNLRTSQSSYTKWTLCERLIHLS